jgi:hypothetical protein
MAQAIEIEWSQDALTDLDRFAAFLHQHHPALAAQIAQAIVEKGATALHVSTAWASNDRQWRISPDRPAGSERAIRVPISIRR